MFSEACPLQKNSSHYNQIKGSLEEARFPPRGFRNVLQPEKMNCEIVFSISPFRSDVLVAFSDAGITDRSPDQCTVLHLFIYLQRC